MRNMKKWIVLASVLLVIGAMGSVITFASSGSSSISESAEFSGEDVEKLDVELNNQKLIIEPSQSSEMFVELEGKGNNPEKSRLQAEMRDDTVHINVSQPDKKMVRFMDWGDRLTLTIYLPKKEYASIRLDVANGKIDAEQFHAKDIMATANNGEIEMYDILSDKIEVESNNGKIVLDHVEGELNGETNNGAISLVTESLDRPMQLNSNNGKIKIETNQEPTNVTFDVRVDNGKIDMFDDSDWDTVIGDGEHRIKLTTHNGSITVE
ncbi:DUF4097 family beta strand repeat-containing protein [Oceanobacillus kapialis]|uniref:DUF4097 family beta strand repeat-containing protein n=1 Tax=Oceanobacillus kapialis TaxID=481353 RepID=UPI00384B08C8